MCVCCWDGACLLLKQVECGIRVPVVQDPHWNFVFFILFAALSYGLHGRGFWCKTTWISALPLRISRWRLFHAFVRCTKTYNSVSDRISFNHRRDLRISRFLQVPELCKSRVLVVGMGGEFPSNCRHVTVSTSHYRCWDSSPILFGMYFVLSFMECIKRQSIIWVIWCTPRFFAFRSTPTFACSGKFIKSKILNYHPPPRIYRFWIRLSDISSLASSCDIVCWVRRLSKTMAWLIIPMSASQVNKTAFKAWRTFSVPKFDIPRTKCRPIHVVIPC